jgi:thymidylate synthase
MNQVDKVFKKLLKQILTEGELYTNERRGVTRLEIPVFNASFEMAQGFPLLSLKETNWHAIRTELLWFLRGDTNIEFLKAHNVKIWDKDAARYKGTNEIGKGYGFYWSRQIETVINNFRNDPRSARHVVQAFVPAHHHPEHTALPPCHTEWQIIGRDNGFDLRFTMRAWDVFLGAPFNIASYALLGLIIERRTGYKFRNLHVQANCVHLYGNQIEPAKEIINWKTKKESRPEVILNYNRDKDWHEIAPSDIEIRNYAPNQRVKVEML